MLVFAIVSLNGGVGRTTVTANLAETLARRGDSVLAMDMDPRNSLGLHLGLPLSETDGMAPRILRASALSEAAFVNSSQVRLLPFGRLTDAELISFENRLSGDETWLKRRLAELQLPAQTRVLIDTPRLPSALARQSIEAADIILNVITADANAYTSLKDIYAAVGIKRDNLFHLLNRVNSTQNLQRDIQQVMRHDLGERLCQTPVHEDAAIPESVAANMGLTDHAPHSQSAHDFQGLATWVSAFIPERTSP